MFGRIFGFGKVYSAEYSDSAKITIRHTFITNICKILFEHYILKIHLYIFWKNFRFICSKWFIYKIFELGVPVEIIVKNITPKQRFKRWLATVAFHTLVSMRKNWYQFFWVINSNLNWKMTSLFKKKYLRKKKELALALNELLSRILFCSLLSQLSRIHVIVRFFSRLFFI